MDINEEKICFLKSVHQYFLTLPFFSLDYNERYYVFSKDISGKERPKGVRNGFVNINCFYYPNNDGSFEGIFNINIQDEDIELMVELNRYLKDVFDYLILNGISFVRIGEEKWKISKSLWNYNIQYDFCSKHRSVVEHSHMESFWKNYLKNI